MAVFNENGDLWQRLDWLILKNGWVSIYCKNEILEKDIDWFKNEKYSIVIFDCLSWENESEMHRQFKKNFNFPEYYGENLDALSDCLSYIEIYQTGKVIVFKKFDKINHSLQFHLLDIFADCARKQLLFGNRFLILVQVVNPNFEIKSIGATPLIWNSNES
jgi:RNAse (barnase) inhibitor barstar